MTEARWAVFTDLDGTLLDHHSYDWRPAAPALTLLAEAGIPVIPVTSKTLAELAPLARELGLQDFGVAENGAVIQLPDSDPQCTSPGYPGIREFLQTYQADVYGFGDMSVAEVVAATGLGEAEAARALQRLASEPFLWRGSEQGMHQLQADASNSGMRLLQGGRFWHLLGDTDKGRALARVVQHLESAWGCTVHSLALGDGNNDRDMLLAADQAVVIRRPDGSHLQLPERPHALITELPGPEGWNQAIQELLAQGKLHG